MPLQNQEHERIDATEALQLMDPAAGASLDRITALAAFAFNAPVAFVSILGADTQRFISRTGLEVAQTPLSTSICSHAITTPDQVLVIDDLTADPRFCDNPLVTGAERLRSYAGAPLVTRNGVAIGALCVMDRAARPMSTSQQQHLRTLADMLVNQLEQRRSAGRLDPVSQLANRQQFHIDYAALVQRTGDGAPCAVLLDVMDVPMANEAGQALGMPPLEAMIHRTGVRLRNALEGIADVYHVGVSRFAFLLQQPSDVAVESLLEELRRRITRPVIAASVPMAPQFHAGACRISLAEDSSNDVLRKLLIGLQAAIQARHPVAWYTSSQDERLRRGYRLAVDAERALLREEFHLVYQPRVATASLRPVGTEALLRWSHPRLGELSPAEFIPVFERTALMPAVSAWVVDGALNQLAAWRRRGIALDMSVNLAPADLSSPDSADSLLDALARRGLANALLEVEVTEGEWLRPGSPAVRQLAKLVQGGVRVAIDDFGSGYSNFGYLSELPLSTLKMDRSLIRRVASDGAVRLKVKAIIDLARGLGYTTVAEGVEEEAQRRVLTDLGCDQLQGYLLGRPGTAQAVEALAYSGGDSMVYPRACSAPR